MSFSPHILILAAGQGKRMASKLPKVLHPVLYKPMLHHVLDLARSLPHSSLSVVVGHGGDEVRAQCARYSDLKFFQQTEQLGTAHAVQSAQSFFDSLPERGHLLILSGDVILLRKSSVERLFADQDSPSSAGSLLSADLYDPRGYGRILRAPSGDVLGIREQVDCDATQAAIREVNAGVYCFRTTMLFNALAEVKSGNRQKEFYLTDVVELLGKQGKKVSAVKLEDPAEMIGINDRAALSEVETILQRRTNHSWMMRGVTIQSPGTVFIDADSEIEPDVRIEAGSCLVRSRVASGSVIESNSRLTDTSVAGDCKIKQGSYLEKSIVGAGTSVGPYAHLRPGSKLGEKVKIGNFVELKNSVMHDGAKASHLSYIGDADIGENTNLGCGFITCNFDGGPKKHRTFIEANVFVGSDSQVVAPVTIGQGSYVASGTTVTEDVPPDSFAISRGRQITKSGYAAKYRERTKTNLFFDRVCSNCLHFVRKQTPCPDKFAEIRTFTIRFFASFSGHKVGATRLESVYTKVIF